MFIISFALLNSNSSNSQNLNKSQVKTLFDNFNEQSQTPFKYKVLEDFLNDVKIEDLKKGMCLKKKFYLKILIVTVKIKCKFLTTNQQRFSLYKFMKLHL